MHCDRDLGVVKEKLTGNFAIGHQRNVVLAHGHRSILNLLMDTTVLCLFASGH